MRINFNTLGFPFPMLQSLNENSEPKAIVGLVKRVTIEKKEWRFTKD